MLLFAISLTAFLSQRFIHALFAIVFYNAFAVLQGKVSKIVLSLKLQDVSLVYAEIFYNRIFKNVYDVEL